MYAAVIDIGSNSIRYMEANVTPQGVFSLHKELCQSFYQMISAVHWLFPSGLDRAPASGKWKEICNERYHMAQEK